MRGRLKEETKEFEDFGLSEVLPFAMQSLAWPQREKSLLFEFAKLDGYGERVGWCESGVQCELWR